MDAAPIPTYVPSAGFIFPTRRRRLTAATRFA
jgi:hypothetical protein